MQRIDLTKEVRALTWKQPFASLMFHGKIETRTRSTSYRGLVLICAGKAWYDEPALLMMSGSRQIARMEQTMPGFEMNNVLWLTLGYAIGIGRLVDCRPMEEADQDACYVKYRPGLWCHIYEDVQRIEPFPWVGQQGWRMLTDEQKALIKILQPENAEI